MSETHPAPPCSLTADVAESMGLFRKLKRYCETSPEIRKRGIRLVIGGEHDITLTPVGQDAHDIEYFVRYIGYSPNESLRCAPIVDAQLMDCDPLADVSALLHRANMSMIMKAG